MNEADVREEIAVPLLAALGYARGTEADILRELSLSYDRSFLGRKKSTDPPLRGRADYVLSVLGAGRWVLEVKAPSQEIDMDAIDQAITYARHPRVAAHYAAILNGRRFVLVWGNHPSEAPPLIDISIESAEALAEAVRGVLGPMAVRRDCARPHVDMERPLAPKLRSRAKIARGHLTYDFAEYSVNLPVPPEVRAPTDDALRRVKSMRVAIVGGEVWRDGSSRILARMQWEAPHEAMIAFGKDKGLFDQFFVSLDPELSNDSASPTTFRSHWERRISAWGAIVQYVQVGHRGKRNTRADDLPRASMGMDRRRHLQRHL